MVRLSVALLMGLTVSAKAHAQLDSVEPQTVAPAPLAAPALETPAQPTGATRGEPADVRTDVHAADPAFASTANWGDPSDHERVIGRLAIAYLGVMGVPVHDGKPGSNALVEAPTLGIRYWFNSGLGLDAGLGLGLRATGGTGTANSTAQDKAGASMFGLGLHLGMPISVWDTAHYNALLIPELNFGFATGTNGGATSATTDDLALSGLLFQVGLRAGAEFHLDFLHLPQATAQITVGIGLSYDRRAVENDTATMGESLTSLRLATNLVSLGSALASGIQIFFYL